MQENHEESGLNVQEQFDSSNESYPMTNKKSGYVYVFNHVSFDNDSLGARYGTMKDCKEIEEAFKDLKFDVIIYHDLDYRETIKTLSKLAETDYSDVNCIVIFVLTHGKNGKIFARDVDYYPDVYWNTFNDKNPTLISKPKLIFIQASRGDEADDGIRIAQADAATTTTYPIPNIPDVLVMYSCYDGFFSWRSSVTGSWFVQCLCKEVKLRAKNTDFLTLLTCLNRRMVMHYSGTVPNSKEVVAKRQIGAVVSTLTKLLYFQSVNK